jgi:hypothetical protein
MTDMDALLVELRKTAPFAPETLRARVDAIAAGEPVQPARLRDRFRWRPLVVIAAPTVFAVMLGVALAHGLTTGGAETNSASRLKGREHGEALPVHANRAQDRQRRALAPLTLKAQTNESGALSKATQAPPAAKNRKQDYRATLTVRVSDLDKLSDATKEVIRATRSWGGYVVTADYAVPGKDGDSTLTVRIPVQHVQAAIQRFSSLGTLAAQDVSIRDVQGQINGYTRELMTIGERIAKIRAKLTGTNLTPGQRASLELQLARAQREAAALRAERARLARTASFATISLTLTTRDAAAAPRHDSRAERTLRDAGSILLLELAFGLFALIVAAPVALLAVLAYLGARVARRRADDRLLGRA